MPGLVVLMPVRDAMPWLASAVTSTLRALPRDSELHVMIDGGGDASASFLSAVNERRLRITQRSHSIGVAATLNDGLRDSDSEFVARMDADDVCLPWRFRRGLPFMHALDFYFTSVVFLKKRTIRGVDLPGRITSDAMRLHLLLGNPLVHPTCIARRNALDKLNGYSITKSEDYDLWLRAAGTGQRMYRDPLPGLLYRRHDKQITAAAHWDDEKSVDELLGPYDTLWRHQLGTPKRDLAPILRAALSGRASDMGEESWEYMTSRLASRARKLSRPQRALLAARVRGRSRTLTPEQP